MKKIIDVVECDYLSVFLGNLIIKKEQGKISIPTNNIDTIVFENTKTTISIPLINKLIAEKVNIIICDDKHIPLAQIMPFNSYFNNKVFLSQLNWDDRYKAITWKNIVKSKIQNQLNLLKHFNLIGFDDIKKMENYILSVKVADLSNCEAHAAKLYYKLLFGNEFRRERSDIEDETNIMLNYGYSVLLAFYSRSLINQGFDNRIGVFHKSFNNPYCLACDIMEIARVIVDYVIYLYKEKQSNYHEVSWGTFKKMLFEKLDEHVKVKNKTIKLRDYIDMSIRKVLENQSSEEVIIDWDSK
ncbi:type II CRISPR-associated endonuclease Cas1 [Metamycoplasma neophronis]|uniref:CRISPR-associated endonuclease Cas1 n=1 Tax=Metamycoplasma neophronis TaxID=872983 RepID=A0ABY2Z0C1_9BACT|nr:type II CRISPR-associated endonuclease Cas1 [Metamycoplasma neophronis]TPR53355.1 type II CRISPR-associated endonuclease Cas1 [Metamycoplasma neophronis]